MTDLTNSDSNSIRILCYRNHAARKKNVWARYIVPPVGAQHRCTRLRRSCVCKGMREVLHTPYEYWARHAVPLQK